MDRTMRIAFDMTIPDRARTGVGVAARHLETALLARGLDVRPWRRALRPGRAGVARLLNAVRLAYWLACDVPRRVRREGVAVYHAPACVGPLRAGCATVLTVHDATLFTWWAPPSPADRLFWRIFSGAAARRADAVIVPSARARHTVVEAYRLPWERVHVVPHGVSPCFQPVPPASRAAVLARHGIGEPYVLFVGARPRRKNLVALVEALARLDGVPAGPPVALVVAGPPEPEDPVAVAAAARLGLAARVRYLGWVPEAELAALYSGAVCLAYPSREEGFGLPVLEAMACGTGVLTSAGSPMADMADGAAVLVDPESVDAIRDGLQLLLGDDGLRAALGARGLARAAEFTWARTAAATEAVYRRVARR
jgi:alpha-1,3-rhamnosyl/mannosyltransferase